jgi:hypothetical protein
MTIKARESVITAPELNLRIRQRAVFPTGHFGAEEADYELLEPLGEGGMRVVYAARQACVDRTVAVKMI